MSFCAVYTLVAMSCFIHGCCSSCPVLECWFLPENTRGGFAAAMKQERSLLHVRTDAHRPHREPLEQASSDIHPENVYLITDLSGSLCHPSLHPPRGSLRKPQCEINPFQPHPSTVRWAASLTDSALSPIHLGATWLSSAVRGLDRKLVLSSVMRAPTGTKEPNVVLSMSTKTVSVQSRLGEPVVLDCQFWVDSLWPLSDSGFAVEWRYQFRGSGRLVLAYDGKSDRLADAGEEGATMDFQSLHEKGNASLILQEAQVRHSGMYICTVYLPYLQAQVAVELEIVEPPSLSIYPSPLPLTVPGQVITVQCEASGYAPLSLELSWEFRGADGSARSLGSGGVTGHRQAGDGTYSQSTRLELDPTNLGGGGELSCIAAHPGGSRRAGVTFNVMGFSAPSLEDSMAMVGVALLLYGFLKLAFWNCTSSGSDGVKQQKKEKRE